MRTMIFAAGLGTRLRPLTDTLPKALVPVSGRPLLAITAERLRAVGATEAVVNVHHFADQIKDYVRDNDFGMPITISDESEGLLDTGGGLRKALPLFSANEEPILIHNVDILSNADLVAFVEQHGAADATLMVSERETQRYLLFNDEMRLMGWTNVATGEVRTPYEHLDLSQCRKLAFAGIHCVSPSIGATMEAYPEKFSITNFYIENCHRLVIRGYIQPDLRLLDVGKQDTLAAAEMFLKTI